MTNIIKTVLLLWVVMGLPNGALGQDHSHHQASVDSKNLGDKSSNWQVSSHTSLTLAANQQSGPRGDDKIYLAGMYSITAKRQVSEKTRLSVNLMLSPDPFMGKGGYPLLLQAGETANGQDHLIDAQHPHDLFMGLSAGIDYAFDEHLTLQTLIGWPGEQAFGPPNFMHRASAENFPTAPISHHWFDSGHISMGVIGVGLQSKKLSLDSSIFNGREPDQNRFDLEPIKLDSQSLRFRWQLTKHLKSQASIAWVKSPEALKPNENLKKTSISIEYNQTLGQLQLDSSLAYGRKIIKNRNSHEHAVKPQDAYLLESRMSLPEEWKILVRYERVFATELLHDHPAWVAKAELGVLKSWPLSAHNRLGLGYVKQFNLLNKEYQNAYGKAPKGDILFLQFTAHLNGH